MEFLVGYTGFVGSNLAASHSFDGYYNSKNIEQAYGKEPDLLVYAGVRAEMFLANHDPAADLANLKQAADNIARIAPKRLVLVSTISVYDEPKGADEDSPIDRNRLTAYGANRRWLEEWVEEHIPGHLIVRLPALYGRNLKKNFLYDYIHYIPPMLTAAKREELGAREPLISECYLPQDNGFYRCRPVEGEEREALKAAFRRTGFSALNFRPLPVARRFRFCTAVSLSTWTSTVPASVMPDRAWMVFVTGMGQASPTALTKILLM